MTKQLLEAQEKLKGSLDHIDLLNSEHKESLKQKKEQIQCLTQQAKQQKQQIERLKDRNQCLAEKYRSLIQGWAALYQQ